MGRASVVAMATSVLAVALMMSSPAGAQPRQPTDEDRAGARAAATAGLSAIQTSSWSEAVDLFTRAESLMHAPTHLLYLARSQAKLGRLVRARETYLKLVREALPPSAPKAFADAQASATTEVSEMESRIPTAKVVVEGDGAAKATVTMDGATVSAALTGIPFPIDPGEHEFKAHTDDRESEIVKVAFADGSRETRTVTLKLSIRSAPKPANVVKPLPASAPAPAVAEAPVVTSPSAGLRTGAIVAFGVGVVGVAAGTVFMLQSRSKSNDADALCPGGPCPLSKRAEIADLDDGASSAATLSWVGYGVGVAGLATGAALYVISRRRAEPAKQGRLSPLLTGTPRGAFAGLEGAF